jgi:PhnB protein
VNLQPESEEEATRLFNALSADGKVTMPLQKTFWNATFGMCTDKFGIQWMVNYDHGQG